MIFDKYKWKALGVALYFLVLLSLFLFLNSRAAVGHGSMDGRVYEKAIKGESLAENDGIAVINGQEPAEGNVETNQDLADIQENGGAGTEGPVWYEVEVHYSRYDPMLGGTNCATWYNNYCHSATASGKPWEGWYDRGAACIKEWPFGTKFMLPNGKVLECIDRGGAIRIGYKYNDGRPWIDELTKNPSYTYGQVITVKVLRATDGR